MPPNIPKKRASDMAMAERMVLFSGVTHFPPGLPAIDSSNSRNEEVLIDCGTFSLMASSSTSPAKCKGVGSGLIFSHSLL